MLAVAELRPCTGTPYGPPRRKHEDRHPAVARAGQAVPAALALTDCTLNIPAGHIVGLVGPNGAGKTTLLHLATGLVAPTTGTIEVLGGPPAASPAQLARVGFVAQDTPAYATLSVADHLRLGAHLNPGMRW